MPRRVVKAGGLTLRVCLPGELRHPSRTVKVLATCFFCGKQITGKGDLERAVVVSGGSEVKVPSCHSCFLTTKKLRGFLFLSLKTRAPVFKT